MIVCHYNVELSFYLRKINIFLIQLTHHKTMEERSEAEGEWAFFLSFILQQPLVGKFKLKQGKTVLYIDQGLFQSSRSLFSGGLQIEVAFKVKYLRELCLWCNKHRIWHAVRVSHAKVIWPTGLGRLKFWRQKSRITRHFHLFKMAAIAFYSASYLFNGSPYITRHLSHGVI